MRIGSIVSGKKWELASGGSEQNTATAAGSLHGRTIISCVTPGARSRSDSSDKFRRGGDLGARSGTIVIEYSIRSS
jgi:hypothetical protein